MTDKIERIFILLPFLFFGCSTGEKSEEQRQIAISEQLKRDESKLKELRSQLTKFSENKFCHEDADCEVIFFAEGPCGGKEELSISKLNSNLAILKTRIDEYSNLKKLIHETYFREVVYDCGAPPEYATQTECGRPKSQLKKQANKRITSRIK